MRKNLKIARKVNPQYVLAFPLFYVFWLLFVGTFSFHELLAGAVAAAFGVGGFVVIEWHYPARFSPTFRELLSLWRSPWYLISGTWEITTVAAKDLLGIERAKSLFRIVTFDAGTEDDPHATARRVLAVTYTTVAPNFIVLGINTRDKKLLFHQIQRSSVPQMTQQLGARP